MRQVLLCHFLESTNCFLWTNDLPCCYGLCWFEAVSGFWLAPGTEPEKNGPLRKKILFLGHISSSHTQILPTSEQEFCSWENRSVWRQGRWRKRRAEQRGNPVLCYRFQHRLKKKKNQNSCRAGYISNQDLNLKWMNANELLLLPY